MGQPLNMPLCRKCRQTVYILYIGVADTFYTGGSYRELMGQPLNYIFISLCFKRFEGIYEGM